MVSRIPLDMGTIQIGENRRDLLEVDLKWITQQINARRKAGQLVCVRVTINSDAGVLPLATSACARSGGGGSRLPSRLENEIIDLWDRRGLNDEEFSSGQVVSFIQQVQRLLEPAV